ncbi:J domain-containing protein [Candidatus Pelagibacter sp.]|nr:J domain-containing protein [Candidatus Pelagibacter sp.]
MNIIIYALIILAVSYILLRVIASASAKKISKTVRFIIFIISILLALLFAFGGRLLLSLPLILLSLGIIKLKGLTLYQLIGLFRLIQTLRSSRRFSFNKNNSNMSTLSVDEAYKILNLDKNNKITKEEVQKAYLKIQKKIHPDISPETSRLSSIVNEAKEVVLKDLS